MTELPARLDTVLQVIYLVFNEGYAASSGASLTRADLSGEAIRLGWLVMEMLPEPEVMGLLALMLLQESRRAAARTSSTGDLILLADQDRSLNRAVAVAMRDGPLAGLQLLDDILAQGDLANYHLAHAARADLCRQLGKTADARAAYQRSLALAKQEPERRFLERRLRELG